jgi:hypothetical protein
MEIYITDGTVSVETPYNYHNIQAKVPQNALFSLTVHDKPPEPELELFKRGNILMLGNVRSKLYKGQLELNWSEKLTAVQIGSGWRARRRCELVPKDDERARVINT